MQSFEYTLDRGNCHNNTDSCLVTETTHLSSRVNVDVYSGGKLGHWDSNIISSDSDKQHHDNLTDQLKRTPWREPLHESFTVKAILRSIKYVGYFCLLRNINTFSVQAQS